MFLQKLSKHTKFYLQLFFWVYQHFLMAAKPNSQCSKHEKQTFSKIQFYKTFKNSSFSKIRDSKTSVFNIDFYGIINIIAGHTA